MERFLKRRLRLLVVSSLITCATLAIAKTFAAQEVVRLTPTGSHQLRTKRCHGRPPVPKSGPSVGTMRKK